MTLQCLNLECKFQPNAWAEYKWAQRIKKILFVEIPCRTWRLQHKIGVAFFVFSGFLPSSREEEKLKGPQSRASFQPNEHFPAESSFLLRSSSVHMLIVRMCIEAADLQQPRLIPCQLIIARVTDSIKRWHFCSAASLSLSLFFFFFGLQMMRIFSGFLQLEEFWPSSSGKLKAPVVFVIKRL